MTNVGGAWSNAAARSDLRYDARYIGDVMGSYVLASRAQHVTGLKIFACRARSVTTREVVLMAPVIGQPGESVTIAFPDLGILRGRVLRPLPGGFAVELQGTEIERATLNSKILWLKRKAQRAVDDRRQHRRVLPRDPHATLSLGDNQTVSCMIIDMSRSGVAVSADLFMPLGTRLAVGAVPGRLVRHVEAGFAVQFDELQALDQLEALLTAKLETQQQGA